VSDPTLTAAIERIARAIIDERPIPSATYRLQLNDTCTFRDAWALIPYLHALGISDYYLSPILKARPGSSHGYDICDHSQLNPALGSPEDFGALAAELRRHGMGLILDVVPNHMGIGDPCNSWWMDVLENGPSSPYATFFDIDWNPIKPELANKVLLPILEDQYGAVLESGKFRLAYGDGAFTIGYGATSLPVAPRTYTPILQSLLDQLLTILDETDQQIQELQSILTALSYLPPRYEADPARLTERQREKEVIKRRISALYAGSAEAQAALDTVMERFNGAAGDPKSFDALDALISAQPYRPAFWRVAGEEINYRRFFDINDLAAIRVELPDVFAATHQLILRLLADGQATGLRIDHPDGLWDPPDYFRRLQQQYMIEQVQARLLAEPGEPQVAREEIEPALEQWLVAHLHDRRPLRPLYVVAEKILSEREPLPQDWAVDGTTGYDFLNAASGIFVNSQQAELFDRIYRDFIAADEQRRVQSFAEMVHGTKQLIMRSALSSEINALGHQINRITEKSRHYRDFTLRGINYALREVIACLEVYRTYTTDPETVTQRDRHYISAAVAQARRRNPGIPRAMLDFLRDTLLLRNLSQFDESDRPAVVSVVMKFQQITGPVMAKSVEDTVFYRYNRLVSLNDVGGNPAEFGVTPADMHRQNAERLRYWPHALLTTTTHDTKRSEDVRARLNLLSELPEEWSAALSRWRTLNAGHKTFVEDTPAPDANDEYLLYQTLLGVWPFELSDEQRLSVDPALRERVSAYMHKATKEAKAHTSWINPNEEYDAAVEQFVGRLLDDSPKNPFLADLHMLQRRIAYFGQFNALAQALLKLTSPGVPDIYQGNELWDFSLVDPDNRRPVDYELRRRLLAELQQRLAAPGAERCALARELLDTYQDGRIKLFLTHQVLLFRRDNPGLFQDGDYQPLMAIGEQRDHVFAYIRRYEDATTLIAVPRMIAGLMSGVEQPPLGRSVWGTTWLQVPDEQREWRYHNRLTGEILAVERFDGRPGIALAAIFRHFPAALLERVYDF
jgi:(1->4)-alpha-D-glucan 1-alpha-D-glucosylmutase